MNWIAVCCLLAAPAGDASPCDVLKTMTPAYRGEVPPGFILNLTAPGEDYRTNPDADDQGPPWEVKRCMLAVTGVNWAGVHIDWRTCEPNPPDKDGKRTFVWDSVKKAVSEQPEGHYLHPGFGLSYSWNKNDKNPFWADAILERSEDEWWEVAKGFITEAAHAVRRFRPEPEEIYYRSPGNEPSLTGKPDWAFTHMKPAKHYYAAVKRADPRNKLIVGALVVGDRGHIEALYQAGLKDHFDVLDIHSYDDTGGKAFFSIAQIIESHQVLSDHGDGDKPIWLGEGWAPFPLPERIDRREEERFKQGLGMSTEPYEYTPEDIEHYRKSIIRGWYNLMTPRTTYDPKWLLGVSYFCLNDMWGSVGWKKRAVPHYDDQGNIEWWDLDGYHIPYQPFGMEPRYRPWGIIDAHGWPKGDIVANVPPYLPKHTFTASVDAPLEGHVAQLVAGQPYAVTLTFTSLEDAPYRNCRFGMDTREKNRFGVQFRPLDDPAAGDLARDRTVTRRFEVTFPPTLVDRELCVIGELDYNWAERVPYYASAWLDVRVLPAARQTHRQTSRIAPDRDTPVELTVALSNPTASIFRTTAKASGPSALVFEPQEHALNIYAGESKEVAFRIRLAPGAPLGTYPFTIDTGSALTSIQSEVTFAQPALDPGTSEWGLLHNGGFEEAVGERGHAAWSGSMTDWDTGDALQGLEGGGQRCVTYAANGVAATKNLFQVLSWPPPGEWTGALEASAWVKGIGFDHAASPSESTFQFRLLCLDHKGEVVRSQESPVRKGTGEWDHFTHRFDAPPEGTAYVRFEIESAISRAPGWHLHHIDRAALMPK